MTGRAVVYDELTAEDRASVKWWGEIGLAVIRVELEEIEERLA